MKSLSARRAWIEIFGNFFIAQNQKVALRKESVDRNLFLEFFQTTTLKSLSARRAWIEILNAATLRLWAWSLSARRAWIEIRNGGILRPWACVALRKESVDRNRRAD